MQVITYNSRRLPHVSYIIWIEQSKTISKMASTRRIPGSKVQLTTCYGEDISGTGLAVQQPSGLLLISKRVTDVR